MRRLVPSLVIAALALGCGYTSYQARFFRLGERASLPDDPFLKIHTDDGRLFVLADWRVDDDRERFLGDGIEYDADRNVVRPRGPVEVPFESIALLETNRPERIDPNVAEIAVLGVMTLASAIMTGVCIATPKTCFGSCPTFYTFEGERPVLQAEGFSGSIARALESTDVDPLFTLPPTRGSLRLRMANEALETHAVRAVNLLAVPRLPHERVLRTSDGAFHRVSDLKAPERCRFDGGDCLPLIEALDGRELLTRTDAEDLAAKETIELVFDGVEGASGLVVAARNSLVNTFLFYQVLAYMGGSAGEWMMLLEGNDAIAHRTFAEMNRMLGEIEVSVRTEKRGWVKVSSFTELGPIAREVQLIPLPADVPSKEVQVRLRMTKGYWKLDQVALAAVGPSASVVRILPRLVTKNDRPDARALERLTDPNDYLFTYPGDAYDLHFVLPPGDHELFVESTGYYYEWIRPEWLAEESATEMVRFASDPRAFLRRMAPRYSAVEEDVEKVFWESRIRHGW